MPCADLYAIYEPMNLISYVNMPPEWKGVNRKTPLLFIGSCFSENIGYALKRAAFPVVVNPFGITYNPMSVMDQLQIIKRDRTYVQSDLQSVGELWTSPDHHGRFSSIHANECLDNINNELQAARQLTDPVVFLTFGTGWLWEEKDPHNRVVNNCHKRPTTDFNRRLPSLDALLEQWQNVKAMWPNTTFVVSISPVRYDDAVANSRGKALLHLFCHELERLGDAMYFPSYEILHHQLRDYRFYASDHKHPSDEAIAYIRDAFFTWALSEDARSWYNAWSKLDQHRQHRPLHPETKAAKAFAASLAKQEDALRTAYPDMDF